MNRGDGTYYYGHTLGTLDQVIEHLKNSGNYSNLEISQISVGTGVNLSPGLTNGYTTLVGFTINYDGKKIVVPFTYDYTGD